ncbi:hypothetical protein C8R44DRAFT_731700 [Mycena epipterygia]|nr:hypothetical protein C8R44DRAFT_731700 [Mycena epipterygia]
MAEFAVVGAVATVGAATLNMGSGFTGRHEGSHHQEMLETRRITDDFNIQNRQSGGVTPDKRIKFLETRDECYRRAIRRENEYHEKIESYKDALWFNPLDKLKKKKAVRRAKRSTRESNYALRKLNESMHSGFDWVDPSGDVEDQTTWLCSVQ